MTRFISGEHDQLPVRLQHAQLALKQNSTRTENEGYFHNQILKKY